MPDMTAPEKISRPAPKRQIQLRLHLHGAKNSVIATTAAATIDVMRFAIRPRRRVGLLAALALSACELRHSETRQSMPRFAVMQYSPSVGRRRVFDYFNF